MPMVDHQDLKPGQRVRITQQVRVGKRQWPAVVEGIVREVQVLVTGLATQRNPDDVVMLATVHFIKDNRELSSIGVDERTQIELLEATPATSTPSPS
ncbi:MAG TPA: hypothetical protein PKD86_02390 [Gemmatales bacterium]|nr:hypothetical protein [Gemmatales bacterium]HMP58179.1 hypothetical protein [Gemmatales bacterium]